MSDAIPSAVRRVVLGRAGGRCERCGRGGRLELHHRQFRGRGGPHTASNLVAVCGWGNHTGCHGWAHSRAHEARGLGWAIPSGSYPADTIPFCDVAGLWWLVDDVGRRRRISVRFADVLLEGRGL